ncbi:hypothetical protein OIU76_013975 [Salix suchowensis]|nr:hypothetical protein OIU76_013975 [Salix suchowensis]
MAVLKVFLASQFFGKILLQEQVRSGDAEALFTLKSAIDPLNSLSWQQGIDVCKWQGVKECKNGRVTKLVVEYQNLSGILDAKILNQLDQLRVLSFKGNSLSGQIPSLSGLVNLKSLFLQNQQLLWKDGPSVVEVRNKGVAGSERGGEASGGGGSGSGSGMAGNSGRKQGGLAWEGEGLGSLVFLGAGDQQMCYSLEDLLKASAETLGRGTVGSTYKAVLESGFIVTVKRLRDSRYPRLDEFGRHMELLGRLRHPSLVPLRAYFQAREERLLVYDYFPNGSLFSLLHGLPVPGK